MFEPTTMPTAATLRLDPGMMHDDSGRLPYLQSEGALYGEVFMLAIRDAALPWPTKPGVESFARRRAIVDAMRFLFDPTDDRRYSVGRMAGMSIESVNYVTRALRSPQARGAYNSGIRPQHLSIVRERADEWFPIRDNPGQPSDALPRRYM